MSSENKPSSEISPSKPKIKHDWYQTETHVIVTILLKNAPHEGLKINYGLQSLSVTCPIPNSQAEYSLELDLNHEINTNQCSHVTVASKIEIKMKKNEMRHWEHLERISEQPVQNIKSIPQSVIDSSGTKYPSSSFVKRDWDKIESDLKKQEAEEKPEGEAALQQLFQQIYGQGNDEVRKAMNKSFLESGGTVLSTNWKEVGDTKVDVQPPDGMEWKKWD